MIPRLAKEHLKTLRPQMAPASLVACLETVVFELLPPLVINSCSSLAVLGFFLDVMPGSK